MEGWHCPVTEAINRRGQFAVIVGGESGPGHRPVKEEWIKTIRDQCEISNIPFLFKQWHKQNDRMFDNRTYDDMPWRTTKEAFAAV
jgi:protein gp37